MWGQLLANIRHTIAHAIFHLVLTETAPTPTRAPVAAGAGQPAAASQPTLAMRENRPDQKAVPAARVNGKKVGRNDPCWCGSGKKFKRCHGLAA